MAIHCLSGSRPWESYGATMSVDPVRVVIQSFAPLAPCGRTFAAMTSAARVGFGSTCLLMLKSCPPLAVYAN